MSNCAKRYQIKQNTDIEKYLRSNLKLVVLTTTVLREKLVHALPIYWALCVSVSVYVNLCVILGLCDCLSVQMFEQMSSNCLFPVL